MKDKITNALIYIKETTYGKLMVSGVLFIVFAILTNFCDWAYTALWASIVYPAYVTLKAMLFAFIINPIRIVIASRKK